MNTDKSNLKTISESNLNLTTNPGSLKAKLNNIEKET